MWGAVVLALLIAGVSSAEDFKGSQVLRIPTSLLSKYLLHSLDVDIWAHNTNFTDMMVDREHLLQVKKLLDGKGIRYDVMIGDVQGMIENEGVNTLSDEDDFRLQGGISFYKYHKLRAIHDYLDHLADNYSDIVTVGVMGYSHENRPLKYVKISSSNPDAKAVFIDAGIHAREWISPAAALYVVKELVENRRDMPQELLDLDFYILPVVNPDGYQYSFTHNRLWRKNRSKTYHGCRGVDLNRNFGHKWGGKGTSKESCSVVFRGTAPFSEPESSAVAGFISAFRYDIKAYISLHSYSQLILLPYAYDKVYPDDFDELKRVGDEAADAMFYSGGELYNVGNSVDILYEASGGSFDWAKAEAEIKYSYTIELRDTGRYGFLLPAKLILPTCQELFEGVKVIAKAVANS